MQGIVEYLAVIATEPVSINEGMRLVNSKSNDRSGIFMNEKVDLINWDIIIDNQKGWNLLS